MNKKILAVIFIFGVLVIGVASFYQRFVVEEWGDIFHVPWFVWITWIFWCVFGIFVLLLLGVILFLYMAFQSSVDDERAAIKEFRRAQAKAKEPTNGSRKWRNHQKTQKKKPSKSRNKSTTGGQKKLKPVAPDQLEKEDPLVKTYYINGKPDEKSEKKVPEHPASWDEEEFD